MTTLAATKIASYDSESGYLQWGGGDRAGHWVKCRDERNNTRLGFAGCKTFRALAVSLAASRIGPNP